MKDLTLEQQADLSRALKEAEYAARRALKQAIRASHRGTMGDPMRPTTR